MNEELEINTDISSGKKTFKVVFENDAYTLIESGSIAAVLKQKDGKWIFTTGSYSEDDAEIIGRMIENNNKASN
jgi:hydrogenase maturation factor